MENSRRNLVEDMTLLDESKFWRQIDISESHMVSGMFEEAATLSASVIKHLRSSTPVNVLDIGMMAEMMESAGMVFVQSWKELQRTRELFDELVKLFGSIAAIPVQVFLTGACMQISEGYSQNLRTIFEEFLDKWVHASDKENVLPNTKSNSSELWQCSIPMEKYMEVVNVYTITILGMILRKPDIAISWVEKAVLPDAKRQDILRKLHSMHLAAHLSSTLDNKTESTKEGTIDTKGDTEMKENPKVNEPKSTYIKSFRPSIERVSDRTFKLKFGNFPLILPRGKTVALSSFVLFTFYIFLKKWAVLKRIIAGQASSVRKAIVDAWQLAFSVQVNPLAAVQQLPAAMPRRS